MPREIVTIECTEARKEGKSPSRYTTTRNKKLKTEKLEVKKYNPSLRRRTVHREIKKLYATKNTSRKTRRPRSEGQVLHHGSPHAPAQTQD